MKSMVTAMMLILMLVPGQDAKARDATANWQMKLVYQPSAAILEREEKGFVFIYDGFTDAEVEAILDHKFERIDSMMFTRVRMTDPAGEVQLDPVTGEELVEDDGCD